MLVKGERKRKIEIDSQEVPYKPTLAGHLGRNGKRAADEIYCHHMCP